MIVTESLWDHLSILFVPQNRPWVSNIGNVEEVVFDNATDTSRATEHDVDACSVKIFDALINSGEDYFLEG